MNLLQPTQTTTSGHWMVGFCQSARIDWAEMDTNLVYLVALAAATNSVCSDGIGGNKLHYLKQAIMTVEWMKSANQKRSARDNVQLMGGSVKKEIHFWPRGKFFLSLFLFLCVRESSFQLALKTLWNALKSTTTTTTVQWSLAQQTEGKSPLISLFLVGLAASIVFEWANQNQHSERYCAPLDLKVGTG